MRFFHNREEFDAEDWGGVFVPTNSMRGFRLIYYENDYEIFPSERWAEWLDERAPGWGWCPRSLVFGFPRSDQAVEFALTFV